MDIEHDAKLGKSIGDWHIVIADGNPQVYEDDDIVVYTSHQNAIDGGYSWLMGTGKSFEVHKLSSEKVSQHH